MLLNVKCEMFSAPGQLWMATHGRDFEGGVLSSIALLYLCKRQVHYIYSQQGDRAFHARLYLSVCKDMAAGDWLNSRKEGAWMDMT